MGEIKRYEPVVEYHKLDRGYPSAKMSKDPDGDYVLYTDHQAALAEAQERVKKLEAENDELRAALKREINEYIEASHSLAIERDAFKSAGDRLREALDLIIDFIPQDWEMPLGFNRVVAQVNAALAGKEG